MYVQSHFELLSVYFCKESYMLMSAEEPVDQSGLLQGFQLNLHLLISAPAVYKPSPRP